MITGKIILSGTAIVITTASSLAFKAASKFTFGHTLFVQVTDATGASIACATCRSVRTKASGGVVLSSCATKKSGALVTARNNRTFFTQRTANRKGCLNAFSKVTKSL